MAEVSHNDISLIGADLAEPEDQSSTLLSELISKKRESVS